VNRLKLAELSSGVGALVLGVGLGALFPSWFESSAGLATVSGLALHAFGMWDKRRLEATKEVASPAWVTALYWLCWLMLGGVLVMLFLRNGV
jgi:hypothetical protein